MFDPAQSHVATDFEAFNSDGFESQLRQRAVTTIEINSMALLQGEREIVIRHGNECYRLRHTRNDKLILTK
ncbi:hypothetical protein CO615_04945 [Lysobacteraceae bacterium NML75-0749]|nr:hypothetical protein CO615_04945 [Xanthomonadaceae bacterium NML75-0749]PJK01687.1 hypothetical protein CO611_00975 [Xanthomonadaceae bacterium NML03-0222]PJK04967.1 hypothetical protein CO609_04805 [Xanthomonadaceae bacterium NML91-0268]PJK05317.1 hypothetical protein CO612_04585 [Xanthomonadaceae bacterium NML71-0210]